MANGTAVTGIFEKNISVTLKVAAK